MTPDAPITIWVPGELPSRNESELAARANRYQAAKMKEQATLKIGIYTKRFMLENDYKTLDRYSLSVTFHCKNKRKDPDNIMSGLKYILDGLVAGGLVSDDRWKNVTAISCSWTFSKNPGVEIRLRPE